MNARINFFPLLVGFCVVLLALGAPSPVSAQEGASLSGYVRDGETGETLIQASAVIEGTSRGAATNDEGYYTIQDLSAGTYTIVFSYIGYQTRSETVTLSTGDERRLNVTLRPEGIAGEEVVVTGDESDADRSMGMDQVETALIKELPSVLQPDVFRTLKLLPGVKTASDYSSNLYIRGGSPGQNLILLDGTTVYNPTHFFGFFSTFNPDAIKDVQLYKGAYPVGYGGRLGGVVDIRNKDGNRQGVGGGVSLGLLASRAYIEGPYGGTGESANGSYMIAVRRSTLEPVLAGLRSTDTDGIPEAFAFYDVNAKINYDAGPDDKLSLALYGGQDRLDLQFQDAGRFDIDYGNQTISADWTHLFGSQAFSTLQVTGSRYRSTPVANVANTQFEQQNGVDDVSVNADVEYTASSEHTLKGGAQWSSLSFQLQESFDGSVNYDQDLRSQQAALYLKDTYEPTGDWTLEAGLRGSYFQKGSFWRLSPRLSVEYSLSSSVQLQAAYGRYHQYLTLETSQLFTGFDTWLMADQGVPPSSSDQLAVGLTTEFGNGWQAEIEGYGRTMPGLFREDPFSSGTAGVPYAERFQTGNGRAYGLEALLRRKTGDFTGFLSYTLGRTERRFPNINETAAGGEQYYTPKYDRTHDLTLVAKYRLTSAWRLTSTFSYSTGQPYTRPERQFSTVDSPFQSTTDERTVLISPFNNDRLPPYHRLDVGATRGGEFFGIGDYELKLQLINAYSRRNIWFYQYERQDDGSLDRTEVPQIPVPIPNLSFTLTF
ncbi:TonB-dependent receptor [Salinibacter grassmerensis]|uniref:TonB-dependent receptor n=1 Tax=Salinibacter grassmerensis TaxID=3040353 RepID=UPI0021E872E0|nr:TonB-dependent receptor [Salinibacter grassmerensis]